MHVRSTLAIGFTRPGWSYRTVVGSPSNAIIDGEITTSCTASNFRTHEDAHMFIC